ncbi:MAG TPA: sulfite exporter TauE/SafE family protein [Acidobacteriota bacterium]|nr:sulfite exporter TauE/SafE family protein [Acidobacteriota bacterium]
MEITFSVSGVHTWLWLPPLVAFCISFFTSMAGVTGAFMLLPFQVSVLGFTSPAVSATNLVYNIIASPSGIFRFLREKRLIWPLALIVILGTLPGVVIGGFIRLHWLPDPEQFKVFAGFFLLYIGVRLVAGARHNMSESGILRLNHNHDFNIDLINVSWPALRYRFQGHEYRCGYVGLFSLSLVVGVLGSIYGIGGGAVIAPFLVSMYRLPVHTVAGATLLSTFATSAAGIIFYLSAAPFYGDITIRPDWMLGALFGLGGLFGIYLGSRTQRYVSAFWLKMLLGFIVLLVSCKYLIPLLDLPR